MRVRFMRYCMLNYLVEDCELFSKMEPRVFSLGCRFIVLAYIAGSAVSLSITDKPVSVTVQEGEDVTLRCDLDGPLAGSYLQWTYYSDEPKAAAGRQISVFGANNPKDPVNGYNLLLGSVTLNNGGVYGCSLTPQKDESWTAEVVVVKRPELKSGRVDATESTLVSIECAAECNQDKTFGDDNMQPLLGLWLGDRSIGAAVSSTEAGSGHKFTLVKRLEYIANRQQNGELVRCRLFSGANKFIVEYSERMNIKYPLQSIDYEPKAERLSVGSNVTCIGDSNPAPRFSWSAITPSQASPVSGAVLDITEDMLGDNEWMCNAIDDKGQPLTVTVSFVVVKSDGGGAKVAASGGKSSWQVPVAVVIVIIVICVIVIVVIVIIRRRRLAAAEGSGPREKPSAGPAEVTNGEKAVAAAPVTALPPTENPGYAGPYRGDGSQNDVSVYPGRDSPGYADLGIRHLGGSNPGLDAQVNAAPDPGASRAVRPPAYSNDMYEGSPKLARRQQQQQDSGSAV